MADKHIEKTLASCDIDEFFIQTNKVRKIVEKWLKAVNFKELRGKMPEFPENATAEEKAEIRSAKNKQFLSDLLTSLFETNAELTKELLCTLCFVDLKERKDYPVREYFKAANELINDKDVVDFFMSLGSLGRSGILG